ncbi:hypothetical protein L1049_005180 [Liquidambar formosana]|uniref:RING-type E3 ubiquitin transferase n=1 Tax=Liquidambar formosana TaxID=63359 RepID=A0AAP0WZ16_LIQFO
MDDNTTSSLIGCNSNSYAFGGKVMLSTVVIVLIVIILILCYHSYGRCFFLPSRRRSDLVHRRSNHLIVQSNPTSATNPLQGLDPSVLKTLPTFVYSTHDPLLECAVCLSEFELNERGRLLPKCKHSFHIKCIDTWFHSHSNCPLCRAPVQPNINPVSKKPVETAVSVGEPAGTEAESGSGPCLLCRRYEDEMGSSSSSSSPPVSLLPLRCERKALELVGISVEVPPWNKSCRGLEEMCNMG